MTRLTYANVIATLALFLALAGGAYAATQLPRNSVGAKQLKKSAVTPSKLSRAAKRRLAGPEGPAGPAGSTGPRGAQGALGKEGPRGREGPSGAGVGAVSFDIPLTQTPGTSAATRTFDGVEIVTICEPSAAIYLGLRSAEGGGTLDAFGTANSFNGGEFAVPVNVTGASSTGLSGASPPYTVDIDAIARDRAVSRAFGRFDIHLDSSTCVLRGMYTPSTTG